MTSGNEGSVSARKGLTPLFRVALAIAALLGMTALAGAQTSANGQATPSAGVASVDTLSGTYKGTAKVDAEDVPVTLELQNQAGKVSGQITVHDRVLKLAEGGSFKEGRLNVKASLEANEMTIAGQVKDDTIVGTWTMAGKTGPIELKKVTAVAAPAAQPATPAANGDAFSGEWDAVADANGQSFPFALTLKIDGEKVTGGSSSELGTSTIGAGTYKDGHVTFRLDGGNGSIAMTATMQEGKLVGDFDYSGQLQGRWVAVRHRP